ncbi:MAG TPA: hypothetical protein VGF45_08680, partial [Polyangia bacterium]
HEMGGVQVYEMAVRCAVHPSLKEEWKKYLAQTKNHVARLEQICSAVGVDPKKQIPGREVVRLIGTALVEAMKKALAAGDPKKAQLVACECVVLAETKDHLDWELIGKCADHLEGAGAADLKAGYDELEEQEDEHLYHSKGWCRELWIEALGMTAVLPPPEEVRKVTTAIAAARAEQAAEKYR